MLVVDMTEVKLQGEAKQDNLAPECGQLIDGVQISHVIYQRNLHNRQNS
jgi:hypothetical protein